MQFREETTMQTKEALQFALTASDNAVMTEIDKMSGDPTKFPTPHGGCHPLWWWAISRSSKA
jgi:hypothetical protein